jgi:alpha-glucoside transport system substrate-binding protein
MHRQASFIPAFFPEGTEVGLDATSSTSRPMPSKDLGKPVLGAGTLWAITNDSPGAQALIEFLQPPIAHEVWMAQKGFLTPYKASTPMSIADDDARG